ncbi:lipid-A-disaccharide synthase-related protein [Oscillatoria sp. CS-180]|uniref:lipid-A-disaccharide synthase-related protein n=1 Tax=Oscillatoria sp. CS-180 TaxID=3021720 RepID=UPI0023310A4A|nr:lipid-A-disaccharide synthase-related protein [Oscillatoria sp. CS-180]MDB9527765.1 lipid-A-disaccharide synthase-related protein [Oscillatoria sp. CS-180]
MTRRVLFLSNGHGEDLNASLVLKALCRIDPEIEVAAMPIVGKGNAYKRLGVKIVGPTRQLPSGGFNYINFGRFLNPVNWWRDTNPVSLLKDLLSGLISLTWRQFQAVQRYSPSCDLLFACGDIVPILFARLTGRPFVVFLVSTSSYYEGMVKLPWLAQWGMKSPQCLGVLTRDRYTAKDLINRGFTRTQFLGYPIMDVLAPTGKKLDIPFQAPLIALLPGSRLPEAQVNFSLMLELCQAIAPLRPAHFHAALVPSFTRDHLKTLAETDAWDASEVGMLKKRNIIVYYHYDAFADILHQCNLVIGMAGTAVEQAVGLGKPIVQIPGPGPQFTYLFAEAQMRLLGKSVITVGTRPANSKTLLSAARKIDQILDDADYLDLCKVNGRERVGEPGGSDAIAHKILEALDNISKEASIV